MKSALVVVGSLILGVGCSNTPAAGGSNFTSTNFKKGGPVIAHIGEETITADEVTARLNEKSPFERQRFKDPATKKEFVENLARVDLLAAEAARRGLDKDPDVVRAAQQVMVRKLVAQEIDENPAKKTISDEDLKAYYDAHHDDFVKPDMVRVSAILLGAADAAAAHQRLPEAQQVLSGLKAKASDYSAFAQVAQTKSDDAASKAIGGDLHFASAAQLTERYGADVSKAAFALSRPGDLSDPVETPRGVYLLKMVQKTPALNQSFEQVKPQLQNRLWYEKRSKLYDSFIEDLKKKFNYSLDEAELAKVEVQPTAPTQGPSSPGTPPAPGLMAQHPGTHPPLPAPK